MKVAVIMGSLSDLPKVEPMIEILKKYEVIVEVRCLSAHRAHNQLVEYVTSRANDDTEVFIGCAGMAAALPGVIAGLTVKPVIGVPISGKVLDGVDAFLSIAQMPPGIPVATVAIDGAKNAAYLALEILGIKYPSIRSKLLDDRLNMEKAALDANNEVTIKY